MAPLGSYGFLTASCLLLAVKGAPASAPTSATGVQSQNGAVMTLPTLVARSVNDMLTQLLPQPTSTPQSIEDVLNFLKKQSQSEDSQNVIKNAIDYGLNGILPNVPGVRGYEGTVISAGSAGINSYTNENPAPPKQIYPHATTQDPRFTVSETDLRAAIYIPSTFDASDASNPTLLVPGTGSWGGIDYNGNIAKVLANGSIAQAVWLNVPFALLQDIQINSEYVTYATNYLNAITGKKVNVIAWSQGNLAVQWTLKYFPSTRQTTRQFIAISPDFHGTVLAKLLDLGAGLIPQAASVLQQEYTSRFVAKLRQTDGDSAYVPTTTFYSIYDEVVQPQFDPIASAFINDVRGVGVINNQIQQVCKHTPAGSIGNHESLLYNKLVVSLILETLQRGRPVNPSEIDLKSACSQAVYPGLDLIDIVQTEATVPLFIINDLEFVALGKGVLFEPPLRPYTTY